MVAGPLVIVLRRTIRQRGICCVISLPATETRNPGPPVANHPPFHLGDGKRNKGSSVSRLHDEVLGVVWRKEKGTVD